MSEINNTNYNLQILNPLLDNDTIEIIKPNSVLKTEEKVSILEEEKLKIMKEIEIKTENKMKSLYESGQLIPPLPIALETIEITPEQCNQQMSLLDETMKVGADEFKQKMGRNMTYSEMRMMFG
jgi:hypothetical protein